MQGGTISSAKRQTEDALVCSQPKRVKQLSSAQWVDQHIQAAQSSKEQAGTGHGILHQTGSCIQSDIQASAGHAVASLQQHKLIRQQLRGVVAPHVTQLQQQHFSAAGNARQHIELGSLGVIADPADAGYDADEGGGSDSDDWLQLWHAGMAKITKSAAEAVTAAASMSAICGVHATGTACRGSCSGGVPVFAPAANSTDRFGAMGPGEAPELPEVSTAVHRSAVPDGTPALQQTLPPINVHSYIRAQHRQQGQQKAANSKLQQRHQQQQIHHSSGGKQRQQQEGCNAALLPTSHQPPADALVVTAAGSARTATTRSAATTAAAMQETPQQAMSRPALLMGRGAAATSTLTLADLLLAVPELPIKHVASPQDGHAKAEGPKQLTVPLYQPEAETPQPLVSTQQPKQQLTGRKRQEQQVKLRQQKQQQLLQQQLKQLERQQQQHAVAQSGLVQDSQLLRQGAVVRYSSAPQLGHNSGAGFTGTAGDSSDEEGQLSEGEIIDQREILTGQWLLAQLGNTVGNGSFSHTGTGGAASAALAGNKHNKQDKSRARKKQQKAAAAASKARPGPAGGGGSRQVGQGRQLGAGGGDASQGLYAELKQWKKEQDKGRRQQGGAGGAIVPERDLRFSISEKPPCKFWLLGRCNKGADCPYPHAGDMPATKLLACKFHMAGCCSRGSECKFSHDVVSKQPCKDMVMYGRCLQEKGICHYSHEQLPPELLAALRPLIMQLEQQEQEQQQKQKLKLTRQQQVQSANQHQQQQQQQQHQQWQLHGQLPSSLQNMQHMHWQAALQGQQQLPIVGQQSVLHMQNLNSQNMTQSMHSHMQWQQQQQQGGHCRFLPQQQGVIPQNLMSQQQLPGPENSAAVLSQGANGLMPRPSLPSVPRQR